MAVRLAGIIMLLLGQLPLHHKDGIALLPQGGQEGAEVELRQWLWRWEQGVEVPEVPVDAPDREPMLLHVELQLCGQAAQRGRLSTCNDRRKTLQLRLADEVVH